MPAQQHLLEPTGLVHQLADRRIAAAIGTLQQQALGLGGPELVLAGEPFFEVRHPQATPGGQVHLQQVIIELGSQAGAMGGKQL